LIRRRWGLAIAPSKYSFPNRLLAVGAAEIRADGPVHLIEEIMFEPEIADDRTPPKVNERSMEVAP